MPTFCLTTGIMLDANKTADNVHLYAKYYSEWGNWLTKESEKIFKEINN